MALAKITVLVCDVCDTKQTTDDPDQAGGITLTGWTVHDNNCNGGAGKKTYICTSCRKTHTVNYLFSTLAGTNA